MNTRFRKQTLAGAAVVAIALAAGCARAPQQPLALVPPEEVGMSNKIPALMEAGVMEAIEENRAPGAVLYAGRDGKLIEAKAIGNRSVDPAVPMTTDTIFDMASVSKVMGTATMAMLLIEDGKMSLDTKVSDILPEFAQNEKGDVTIEDLLTHRSGLVAYDQWTKAEAKRTEGMTHDEALFRHIASLEKIYPTGKYINYSCLNFLTLARLNEAVAGESQHSFLTRRVWKPLGMNNTGYLLTEEQKARVAPVFKGDLPDGREYATTHDPLAYYYQSTMEHCPGNAGLFSCGEDVAKYCQMILNGGELGGVRVMKPETVDLMTSVHAKLPQYGGKDDSGKIRAREPWMRGLGWHVYADAPYTHPAAPENSFIGHTGYTGTYLWLDKNANTFVVLLANAVYSADPPRMTEPRKRMSELMNESVYGPYPAGK